MVRQIVKPLVFLLAFAAVVSAGCQPLFRAGYPSRPGDPVVMARPQLHIADRWEHRDDDGRIFDDMVVAVSDDMTTLLDSEGCARDVPHDILSPPLAWRNCPGRSDGVQSVSANGAMWPLRPDSRVIYDIAGHNLSGEQWHLTRECAVVGEVEIQVAAGEVDAWRVDCEDPWRHTIWYLAPEIGRDVLRMETDRREGTVRRLQLVNFEPGGF